MATYSTEQIENISMTAESSPAQHWSRKQARASIYKKELSLHAMGLGESPRSCEWWNDPTEVMALETVKIIIYRGTLMCLAVFKDFTSMLSLHLHESSIRLILLFSLHRWENWGPMMLNNLQLQVCPTPKGFTLHHSPTLYPDEPDCGQGSFDKAEREGRAALEGF